jgi:WD40 repeat protein
MGKIKLHLGEVSRLILSPDGKYVISAGHDGTIFLMTMTDLASEPIPGLVSPPPKDTINQQQPSITKASIHTSETKVESSSSQTAEE